MSSEPERHVRGDSCPDFARVQTGVGILRVPPGMAAQLHGLYHNGMIRRAGTHPGISKCMQDPRHRIPAPLSRAPPRPRSIQRHHHPPQNRSPAPRPPPSVAFDEFLKQWERLLTWATLKTLTDHSVMPLMPARQTSSRLAKRILTDYGPNLRKWLGPRT